MSEKEATSLDTILKNTDIVDLIGEVTELKKRGKNYMGLCPFHEENTPSFSVSEEKQVYHCFSCKRSGNALTFVEETKNLSRGEAVRYLAERAGLDYTPGKKDPNAKYHEINQDALDFFKVHLNHTKSGREAFDYLMNRGMAKETFETFELGLAPNKKDALYRALSDKGHLQSDMRDLGLIGGDDAPYDIFKDRIMFPLHDEAGNVVGFSGRTYKEGVKTAKYMNSPTTPVFEKHKVLYNIHRIGRAAKENDRVVIFEGFMDVIAAHQAGIREGVAVMGTALSATHIRMIRKLTENAVLAFDGDQAGRDATRRFIGELKKGGMEVYVAELEEGLDPDDYIRKEGAEPFKKLIHEAKSASEFLYEEQLRNVNLSRITEIEAVKKRVFTLISRLSRVEQDHFLNRLSKDLGIDRRTLDEDFSRKRPAKAPEYRQIQKVEVTDKFKRAERAFIHYFLKDEYYSRRFRREFDDVTYIDKAARDIQFEIFEYYDFNRQSCIVPKLFIERLTEDQRIYFEKHIDYDHYPYHEDEFEDLIGVMREYTRRNRINTLKKRLEQAESIDEKIRYRKKIDAIIKEVNHAKRKNHSGTH
ncbi:MAG: DNA primase [Candidatus Izemoplasmataceae bacterium]